MGVWHQLCTLNHPEIQPNLLALPGSAGEAPATCFKRVLAPSWLKQQEHLFACWQSSDSPEIKQSDSHGRLETAPHSQLRTQTYLQEPGAASADPQRSRNQHTEPAERKRGLQPPKITVFNGPRYPQHCPAPPPRLGSEPLLTLSPLKKSLMDSSVTS